MIEYLKIYKIFGRKLGTSVFLAEIPNELKKYKQFLLWKEVDGRKIPYSFEDGKLKAVNARDEKYHLTFDDAILYTNSMYGLMFVLENTNFWCLDFDDFENVEEVKEIVEKAGSYAEITPSGQGFRIWFKGHNPFTSKDKTFKLSDGRLIEVFTNKQVTVTGYRISEEKEINEIQADFVLYLKNKYISSFVDEQNIKGDLDERAKRVLNALVEKYNGKVYDKYITLSCPLHPPDEHPSATIYFNDSRLENMQFLCHHEHITMSLIKLLEKLNLMQLLYDFGDEEDEKYDFTQEIVDDWKKLPHQRKTKIRFFEEILIDNDQKIYVYLAAKSNADVPFFILCREPKRMGDHYVVIRKKFFLSKLSKKLEKARILFLFKKITDALNSSMKLSKPKEYVINTNVYEKMQEYRSIEQELGYTLFYEEMEPAELEAYKPKDNENIEELIRYGLYKGAKYDKNIELLFRAFLIKINRENHYLARYAPHAIIVTNSKVGKSTLAKIIAGRSFEANNVTSKSLVGFGTSDNIKEGTLNFTDECIFYDEINTLENEELTSGLLNLMELGTSDISKGFADFTTTYGNAHVFLSNKKLVKENEPLEVAFLRLLLNIHKNVEGLGSRIAIIFYNSKCETVKTSNVDLNKLEKASLIFEVLRKKISEKYVDLVNNEKVREWLEQEFTEEYINELKEICKTQGNYFQEIKTFILSYTQAYRHVRGAALRIALFEPAILYKILHDELDIEDLLNTAQVYFEYLCKVNKTSFEVLKNTSFSDFEKINLDLLKLFNSTASDAVKILVFTTKLYYEQYNERRIDTFENSKFVEFYNEKIKNLFTGVYAQCFARVFSKIKTLDNEQLEKLFGLNILKQQDKLTIVVNDDIKLLTSSFDLIELKSKQNLGELYKEFKKINNIDLYCETNQKQVETSNEEREINKKLSDVIKKNFENSRKGKELLFCELINCYNLDEDIDFELIKEYYSKKFQDVEYVDYLIRKLSEEGLIYEYKQKVYRKSFDFEVSEIYDE
ncbi:MAG: hypothetical protein QXR30_04990 [Candidatus Woesearchaeota archaeon]